MTQPLDRQGERVATELRDAAVAFVESARRITGTSDLSIGAYNEMAEGLAHIVAGYLAEREEEQRDA